jgi:hypothetical protein
VYVHLTGYSLPASGVLWITALNLLSLACCVAFIFMGGSKAWRIAALFNASFIILVLIAAVLRFGA